MAVESFTRQEDRMREVSLFSLQWIPYPGDGLSILAKPLLESSLNFKPYFTVYNFNHRLTTQVPTCMCAHWCSHMHVCTPVSWCSYTYVCTPMFWCFHMYAYTSVFWFFHVNVCTLMFWCSQMYAYIPMFLCSHTISTKP